MNLMVPLHGLNGCSVVARDRRPDGRLGLQSAGAAGGLSFAGLPIFGSGSNRRALGGIGAQQDEIILPDVGFPLGTGAVNAHVPARQSRDLLGLPLLQFRLIQISVT